MTWEMFDGDHILYDHRHSAIVTIRRTEAGYYVFKKCHGFLLDDAGDVKFFPTAASAIEASEKEGVYGDGGYSYKPVKEVSALPGELVEDDVEVEDAA